MTVKHTELSHYCNNIREYRIKIEPHLLLKEVHRYNMDQKKRKAEEMDDTDDASVIYEEEEKDDASVADELEEKDDASVADDASIAGDIPVGNEAIVDDGLDEEMAIDEDIGDDMIEGIDVDDYLADSSVGQEKKHSDYHQIITEVPRELRITSDIMTAYEFCEAVGVRAEQIERGFAPFIDVGLLTNSRDIALQEMFDRRSPLVIIRKVGEFSQEVWSCNEMGIPADYRSEF